MAINPDSVRKLLYSSDFGDRVRGLNQLRQMEAKLAFEMLKPLITDANARVRYAAVSQLDTLGREDLATALNLLRDRLLNDPEVDVKAAAADAIGGLQLTEAFDDLEQLYHQTSDWLIQLSIIATLGELGEPRGFDLLREALTSETGLLTIAAISSLGELGDSRAVSLLLPFTTHPDWQVRHRLVQALGLLGGPEARAALETLARDSQEQVAQEAKSNLESG